MIKHLILLILSALLPALFLPSCGGGDAAGDDRELRREIRAAAVDGLIDEGECQTLREASLLVTATKDLSAADWVDYLQKAKPRDVETLTVNCSAALNSAPATAQNAGNCSGTPERVNIYIENSGSMYAYMDKQSAFYNMLTDFVVQFNDKDQAFDYYLINDKEFLVDDLEGSKKNSSSVYDRKQHLESWLNPTKMRSKGNPASSRLMEVVNKIGQASIADCEPRMLVSDFIYSVTDNANMEKEMNKVQSNMSLIFNDVAKAGLGILMIKFDSEFNGNYYPRNSPNKGYKYSGRRPFYCWMIGPPAYLNQFPSTYSIGRLPGYESHALIAPKAGGELPYSIMPYSGKPTGEFVAEPKGKGVVVKSLVRVEPTTRGDRAGLRMAVGVDMGGLNVPEDYLSNPANYRVDGATGEDNWRVASIERGRELDRLDEGRLSQPPTHLLVLEADGLKARERNLEIKLLDKPDEWLTASHTESDLEPEIDAIAGKTFGFRYLVDGVWDAYHPRKDELLFFSLPITLER